MITDAVADAHWPVPLAGLLCGLVLGAVARHNRFCTLSALERRWYAGDDRGVRAWVLAGAVALIATQALALAGLVDLDQSFYLRPRLSLLGALVGGLLFGVGMALVGTCAFGALVRLGGGSLRSLIVVLVVGLAALSAQYGPLGALRERAVEPLSVAFGAPDQSVPTLVGAATGLPLERPVLLLCIALPLLWVFGSRTFRREGGMIVGAIVVGLCIATGWLATSQLGRVMFAPVQVESASFVLPPGQLVRSLIGPYGLDYGVGLVVGVVIGAAFAARRDRDVRWEACDDARELGRHLAGAVLMGVGGVLAAGCTIGQGLSAMSVLALSAPIAVAGMLIGARLGLAWLLEGSLGALFARAR